MCLMVQDLLKTQEEDQVQQFRAQTITQTDHLLHIIITIDVLLQILTIVILIVGITPIQIEITIHIEIIVTLITREATIIVVPEVVEAQEVAVPAVVEVEDKLFILKKT